MRALLSEESTILPQHAVQDCGLAPIEASPKDAFQLCPETYSKAARYLVSLCDVAGKTSITPFIIAQLKECAKVSARNVSLPPWFKHCGDLGIKVPTPGADNDTTNKLITFRIPSERTASSKSLDMLEVVCHPLGDVRFIIHPQMKH